MNVKEKDAAYVAHTYKRFPVEIVDGKGSLVYDETGKEYVDLGTGIAANTFGVADEEWIEAVTRQLGKVQHTSNLYYHRPGARLAELLCEKTGMKKVFFCNSGAEANECAIKTARRWAFRKTGDESRSTIVTLKNSFHGRTVTTLAATGQDSFHTEFGPFTPGFVYADPDCPEQLEELVKKRNEVMKENVPGSNEGSYMITNPVITPGYWKKSYKGREFTEIRSLWETQNDYMGGPFISDAFRSSDGKDVIVIEGFVYAPKYDKRDYLRQVEAIIYSWH